MESLTLKSNLGFAYLRAYYAFYPYNYGEGKIYMPESKSPKKNRGRQRKIDPQIVLGNADAFRAQFTNAWPILGERLLAATTSVELWEVVKSGNGIISNRDYLFSESMFQIIHDAMFPRVRLKAQIRFLADSMGGCGFVTARRSREICAEERAKVEHHILRREFYIECSCGYEGPALNGGCRQCGTSTPVMGPYGERT
jgi:hypothetical protein